MAKRPTQRGVTLAELLVTIVLATIFFAAMVPLFVYASQTSAGDNARTVALGIAQDKIERIRSLPYGQVQATWLNADTVNGFGHQASAATGGKVFLVDYSVDYIYAPSQSNPQPGLELYKKVTVDVYWAGAPQPVKHVVLTTMIYRQYASPILVGLDVEPHGVDARTHDMIVPRQSGEDRYVDITATAMTGTPTREVRFKVASGDGSYSETFTQPDGAAGVYVWPWKVPDRAPDGFYTITATAVSPGDYLGNTWRVVEQLERGSVPAPLNLAATPGDNSVDLRWDKPAAGDIAFYEIWRSKTNDLSTATMVATSLESVNYPDTSAVNYFVDGDYGYYYYWVYAHDLAGYVSDPSNEPLDGEPAQPSPVAGDHDPPSIPTLTATVQPTSIALSWTPSQDTVSGVDYYEIHRSVDGVAFTFLTQVDYPNVAYIDPVGSDSVRYWYEIRAVDASPNINRSDPSLIAGPVQTPATKTTLAVVNKRKGANDQCTVTVQDVVSKLYYDQNGDSHATAWSSPTIGSKGGTASWYNLPIDKIYSVTATFTSTSGNVTSATKSASAPLWTVTFE